MTLAEAILSVLAPFAVTLPRIKPVAPMSLALIVPPKAANVEKSLLLVSVIAAVAAVVNEAFEPPVPARFKIVVVPSCVIGPLACAVKLSARISCKRIALLSCTVTFVPVAATPAPRAALNALFELLRVTLPVPALKVAKAPVTATFSAAVVPA